MKTNVIGHIEVIKKSHGVRDVYVTILGYERAHLFYIKNWQNSKNGYMLRHTKKKYLSKLIDDFGVRYVDNVLISPLYQKIIESKIQKGNFNFTINLLANF